MDHRITYLRDDKYQPVGCIAIKLNREAGHGNYTLIEYQYSVLNPADRFDRALARQIALGRLVEAPYTTRTNVLPTKHQVTEAVMKDIAKDKGAPARARKSAKGWLDSFGWFSLITQGDYPR